MRLNTLLTILQAAHWSHLVESEWQERGGIILVAPPANLKSSTNIYLDCYSDALVLGDINVKSLVKLRDEIAQQRYRTLVFPELEKVYQRNPQVSSNVEGHIKQFVEEGMRAASFEDSRLPIKPARCLVIASLTPACVRRFNDQWVDSGFKRRFLWCHYSLNEPLIADAIEKWRRIEIPAAENVFQILKRPRIPYNLTAQESSLVRLLVKHQTGHETPQVLLKKIFVILKYKDTVEGTKQAKHLIEEFGESLRGEGAVLSVATK